jgi:hypothetical protein
MPSCLRCGKTLAQVNLKTRNWAGNFEKRYFSCTQCGASWLYSKSYNCPVLLDPKSIIAQHEGARTGGDERGR